MKVVIRHALALGILMIGLAGIAYPLIAAGVGHMIFPVNLINGVFGIELPLR